MGGPITLPLRRKAVGRARRTFSALPGTALAESSSAFGTELEAEWKLADIYYIEAVSVDDI